MLFSLIPECFYISYLYDINGSTFYFQQIIDCNRQNSIPKTCRNNITLKQTKTRLTVILTLVTSAGISSGISTMPSAAMVNFCSGSCSSSVRGHQPQRPGLMTSSSMILFSSIGSVEVTGLMVEFTSVPFSSEGNTFSLYIIFRCYFSMYTYILASKIHWFSDPEDQPNNPYPKYYIGKGLSHV